MEGREADNRNSPCFSGARVRAGGSSASSGAMIVESNITSSDCGGGARRRLWSAAALARFFLGMSRSQNGRGGAG